MEYYTKPIKNDNINNIYGKNFTNKNQGYRIVIEKKDKPTKAKNILNLPVQYISSKLVDRKENKNYMINKDIYNSVKPKDNQQEKHPPYRNRR